MTDRSGYVSVADHEEAAVAWVLHTLEPDDEVTFLRHLDGCAGCRRSVADVTTVLSSVGESVPQEEPPARLRESLLAAVAEEPAPPRPAASPGSSSGSSSRGVSPADELATVVPIRRSRARRLAAVAAVAVLVAVVGGLIGANRSLQRERDTEAARAAQVTTVLRDAGRPGAVHATLADRDGAMVGMVVDAGSGPQVLVTGLGGNRADQTYVLWSLAGAAPRSVGMFDVSGSEPSVRSVGSVDEAGRPAAFAVSLEPGRTVPASPTTIVASGQVGR